MALTSSPTSGPLDVGRLRADFPLLAGGTEDRPIVYLDSAATSQKPQSVLDAMNSFYVEANANVHRGAYGLAQEATERMEGARDKIAAFIGARHSREIIFTRNATEAMNLVANAWGRSNLSAGDAIVLTHLEHHANIVPWQMLQAEIGFEIRWIPLTDEGHLDLEDLDRLLDGAALLGFSAASNVLGTVTPTERLCSAARAAGAISLVDACQLVPHLPVDVQTLDCDLLAFSAHKMCGPTGIGVLYGREDVLNAMPPFLGGGEMILDVRIDGFTVNELPWKFEAGTPAIAEAVGLGAAVDYLSAIGMEAIRAHEVELAAYALRTLTARFGDDLTIFGPSEPHERSGVMSFVYRDVHPHDISQILDQNGVSVRAGHHCAKPLHRVLGIPSSTRASFYLYNDEADVDAFADALDQAGDFFGI